VRRKGKVEKLKKLKIKNDRCKESGSKIREECKEVSAGTILQVD